MIFLVFAYKGNENRAKYKINSHLFSYLRDCLFLQRCLVWFLVGFCVATSCRKVGDFRSSSAILLAFKCVTFRSSESRYKGTKKMPPLQIFCPKSTFFEGYFPCLFCKKIKTAKTWTCGHVDMDVLVVFKSSRRAIRNYIYYNIYNFIILYIIIISL